MKASQKQTGRKTKIAFESMSHSSTSQALLFSRIICSGVTAMSSSFSPSSLRLFSTRIPISSPPSQTLIPYLKPSRSLFLHRTITFQKVATKIVSPFSASSSASASASASASNSVDLQPIEELPPKLQEIIRLFQSVQEPKAKYEQLLFYGKNLKPLDAQFKTRENKVEGCVSQVWVRAFLDEDRNVVYEADSDSVLTKGLAALLVQGLSGRPVAEILRVSPDFVVQLGLQQSLTPSRNNGFLNMLKLMQKKGLQLVLEAEESRGSAENSNSISESGTQLEKVGLSDDLVSSRMGSNETRVWSSDSDSNTRNGEGPGSNLSGLGSRGMRIKEKLERELSPVELDVEDVSYQHAGHAGVRGSDGETHFNLKVVSKEFEGKSLVKRHRLIYELLQDELQSGLHALSIVAKTPTEIGSV